MAEPNKKSTQKDPKIQQKLNAIQGTKKVKTTPDDRRRRAQTTDSNN